MKKSGTPAKVRRKVLGGNESGVDAEANALDQRAPALEFQLRALELVGGGAAKRNQAHHGQSVQHAFVFECRIDRRVGRLDHIGRGFGGSVKTEPFFNRQLGEALFSECGDIRYKRRTGFALGGQDAHLAGFVVGNEVAVWCEHAGDLAADHVGHAGH